MLKLKLKYFGHLMQSTDSFEKTRMLGKIEGRRWMGWQRMVWWGGITDLMDMSLSKLWDLVMDRKACHAAVHGGHKQLDTSEQLNWTDYKILFLHSLFVCASLVAQLVKAPPAMWETWVQSLVWEDCWRRDRLPIPIFWAREFHGLYSSWGCKESDTTEQRSFHFTFIFLHSQLYLLSMRAEIITVLFSFASPPYITVLGFIN